MDALLWKRIGELFEAARELEGQPRLDYLREHCGSDKNLLDEVLSLLYADGKRLPTELPDTVTTLSIPDVVAGRFRIVRFIAEGGMGAVYEAEDLQLRERVALKTFRPGFAADEHAVQRFKQEIHLGKSVTHPNVCRLHDLVIDHAEDGTEVLYLSMEYLEGESLATRIKRGPLPNAEALPLIEDMCHGLAAAHQADVIHRDFKSGNVMLVKRSGRTHGVITDFGLARTIHTSDFRSHTSMAGTVDYMAPEQIRGEELTPATDIYALGVVMYEMMTGQRPFTSDSKITVAMKHLNDEPAPPRDLMPTLDQCWNDTILHCLIKEPDERFQSALEVKTALAEGPPSHAGWLKVITRGTTRFRQMAILAALLVLVTAGVWLVLKLINTPPKAGEPARIAVLPFDTRGTSKDRDYLGDGLADEIAGLLSHVRTLQVVSPVSVQRFKNADLPFPQIASQLNARYFVTGSVEGLGDQIRIRVRMLNASTGILWARNFDRDASNKLTVENEVAQEVVQSLALALGAEESRAISTPVTQNPQAFEAYLRGKSLVRMFNNRGQEEDFSAAEAELKKAIQFDRQMAAAYGELAHLYFLHDVERARATSDPQRLRITAEQALALDPKQIAALDALAMMYEATGGTDAAYRFATQVLTVNPRDPGALLALGVVYGTNGMLDDSLLAFRKAADAEPLYLYPMTNAAETLVMMGRLDEAWQEIEAASAIESNNYSVILNRAWIRYHQGRLDEAEQILHSAQSQIAPSERAPFDLIQAWIYSRRGQHTEAQSLLRQVQQSRLVQSYLDMQLWLGEGWALENQPDIALPILTKVGKMHPNYPWFTRNPNLQQLRSNSEFEKLLAAMESEWEQNRMKYQKAADVLGSERLSSTFDGESTWPAAAVYNIDSRIPSMPSSRSIIVSANAAVQSGCRLSAVAVSRNV